MSNILLGLSNVVQPMNILICLGGLVIGVLFGALPGFSATMAVAVFVPFTYTMEPGSALLLLSGLYCGGVYGGSIPAVLVGIPGTPASAPTALEGKALVKKGEAGRALNLVTMASAFGGFFSSCALLICAPLLAKIAMMVGAPEQIFVAIFGLSVVVMLSQDNLFKGCMVAIISLLIACFGQDPVLGFPRFTYGRPELTGGFDVTIVLIGLFSLPEVFKMLEDPLAKMAETGKVGSMKLKMSDVTDNIFNAFRSAIWGTMIGIIPAAGPDIAAFLAYNEARKSSKHPEEFGNGAAAGIIAAEAGNNGATGGSLIPLLTLGIPGSAPAAIFLGAMIIHGVRPGPTLFTEHAETVYTMIVGFAVINLLLYFVGLAYCKGGSMVLKIPKAILATVIVVLATVGTFSINKNLFDVFVMFGAGVLGYIMVRNDFPTSPIALALLLGPMLEKAVSITTTMYEGHMMDIFTRPLTTILMVFTIFSFIFPFAKSYLEKKKKAQQTNPES
ncbi:MAG: tripartite tricarboxylate transporter permease [Clostridiales bacterium]|nr:tripartite tricarboxylate transporter permease [Clostridiales bacterium]